MPKLVRDQNYIKDFPGRKNASVGGSEGFSNDGFITEQHEEIFLVIGDEPREEPVDELDPQQGTYYILDTEADILATPGLPILGQKSRGAWCIDREATCVDDTARLWEVRCQFQSNVSLRVKDSATESYVGTGSKDPSVWITNRLDTIKAINEWGTESITEPLIEDQQEIDDTTGELIPVVNTVGEPMYPNMQRVVVVLNVDYFLKKKDVDAVTDPDNPVVIDIEPPLLETTHTNTVNSGLFYGMPAGCVTCTSLNITDTGELPFYADLMPENPDDPVDPPTVPETFNLFPPEFWHIKAMFKMRFWYQYNCQDENMVINKYIQGWILKILNQGNYMRQDEDAQDPANTNKILVDGHLLSRSPVRVNLGEDGYALKDLEPPVWLEFNRYPKSNFDDFLPVHIRPYNPEVDLIPDNPGTPPCT